MTQFPTCELAFGDVDDRLMGPFLAPWAATGVIAPQDARLFGAALASDPALEDDLAAARAEHAAVCAMGEAMGRPSMRPMLALFAAIDEGAEPPSSNVTRLTCARPARTAFDTHARIDFSPQKFRRVR